jgi:hypothetical protein
MRGAQLRLYPDVRRLFRRVFVAFLLTFVATRLLVFGIMARWLPDLFWHFGGTHVHHLNYGIFLLAGIGAFLLVAPVSPASRLNVAWLYGIGLALTFDEFGMWLHLGGGYWQRASFDAVMGVRRGAGHSSVRTPCPRMATKALGTGSDAGGSDNRLLLGAYADTALGGAARAPAGAPGGSWPAVKPCFADLCMPIDSVMRLKEGNNQRLPVRKTRWD